MISFLAIATSEEYLNESPYVRWGNAFAAAVVFGSLPVLVWLLARMFLNIGGRNRRRAASLSFHPPVDHLPVEPVGASNGSGMSSPLRPGHNSPEAPSLQESIDFLEQISRRLPVFLAVIRGSRGEVEGRLELKEERDLQDLMKAILSLHYNNVLREDPVQQYAGAWARVDLFIKDVGLMVETKMTGRSTGQREVGDQLIVDMNRYATRADCRGFFALVYDPDRQIDNPNGFERDLAAAGGSTPTRVVVVQGR